MFACVCFVWLCVFVCLFVLVSLVCVVCLGMLVPLWFGLVWFGVFLCLFDCLCVCVRVRLLDGLVA